jgi:hypothetical protein
MAGCLFTNGTHVLSGLQRSGLSGFGGKKRFTETHLETAWRETMEELFGFHDQFIKSRLNELCAIRPTYVKFSDQYVCYIYTFKDLEKALSILKKYHPISSYYRYFPMTIMDLILNRRNFPNSEVGTFALLPISPGLIVAPEFQHDLEELCKN